jgi:signal peptidase II
MGRLVDAEDLRLKTFAQRYASLFLIVGFILIADQLTKSWVRSSLALGETWAPIASLADFVRIVNWYNTGVAFGMLQGRGYMFAILAVIVSGVILYYYPRIPSSDRLLRLALSLQMAGALGNLIDRLTQDGRVTDFIWIGNFPVWNIADASITIGVGVLLLSVWIQDRRQKSQAAPADPVEEAAQATLEENG